jgi:thioredoxin reductase (NADPH)
MRDGRKPRGWTLERDPFLLETSAPGVFAAGDVRHESIKRVASAVGEGSMAVQFVHRHLSSQ